MAQEFSQINNVKDELRRCNDLVTSFISRPFNGHEVPIPRASLQSSSHPEHQIPSSGNAGYNDSIVKLDVSRFSKKGCRPFCSCVCHRRYRKRPITPMNKLLGCLFVGYSNIPFWGVTCDNSECIQPSKFSATFTYYFPSWFVVKQMFSLVLMTTHLGDPGGVLKIRKIQVTDFSFFKMSEKGDVKGMKSMLDRQTIHPSTTWWGGWSALHVSNCHSPTFIISADLFSMPSHMGTSPSANISSPETQTLFSKTATINSKLMTHSPFTLLP